MDTQLQRNVRPAPGFLIDQRLSWKKLQSFYNRSNSVVSLYFPEEKFFFFSKFSDKLKTRNRGDEGRDGRRYGNVHGARAGTDFKAGAKTEFLD